MRPSREKYFAIRNIREAIAELVNDAEVTCRRCGQPSWSMLRGFAGEAGAAAALLPLSPRAGGRANDDPPIRRVIRCCVFRSAT